jgi:gliding motility-associated-like protein
MLTAISSVAISANFVVVGRPVGPSIARGVVSKLNAPHSKNHDASIQIDATNVKARPWECDAGGSISGLVVTTYQNEAYSAVWLDGDNRPVKNTVDIVNLPPGSYTLTVTDLVNKSTKSYGPVVINTVPPLTVNQNRPVFDAAYCGQHGGSLIGFQVQGGNKPYNYSWRNEKGVEVSTELDLKDTSPGKYSLHVTDDSPCGEVVSTGLEVLEFNRIRIDESNAKLTIGDCSNPTGSVTGITAIDPPAGIEYQWVDENGTVVQNSQDLLNQSEGTYRLVISAGKTCSIVYSAYYTIRITINLDASHAQVVEPTCSTTGSITGIITKNESSYAWKNAAGATIAITKDLFNVKAGGYQLYISDACGHSISSDVFNLTEAVTTYPVYPVVVQNACYKMSNGAITVNIGDLAKSYRWVDSSNQNVGTQPGLFNLPPGNYTLYLNNKDGCEQLYKTYTVTELPDVVAPAVHDVQLCSAGSGIIRLDGLTAGSSYRLYNNADIGQPLEERGDGIFLVNAAETHDFYVSKVTGTCEGPRAKVTVSVGVSPRGIANTFTPNNDGINDYWRIENIESYTTAIVQVFSRDGQLVFESKGYVLPFDGNLNGKALPVGSYYYIINLGRGCNIISGSLTLIR